MSTSGPQAASRCILLLLVVSMLVAGCERHTTGPTLHRSDQAFVPTAPPAPWIALYGVVTGLTNGAALILSVNGVTAAFITTDGGYKLLSPRPVGTSFVVSIPYQPSGHVCTLTNASGRLVPGVPAVTVTCGLATQLGNDLEARETFGQPTSTSNQGITPPTAATLLQPWGKTYTNDAGDVYMADRGNHRVLAYYPAGVLTGKTALFVMGQNNDFTAHAAGLAADAFNEPCSVQGSEDTLVVTDCGNHRVLIFNTMPHGQVAADVVVGQPDFVTGAAGCSPNNLSSPTSAIVINGQLVIADSGNARLLLYDSIPTANFTPADLVLGQASKSACQANRGGTAASNTLSSPQDVWSNGTQMFVTDLGNHRVLGWKYVPIFSGETADIVVGQPDMATTATSTTTSNTLASPMYVTSDGITLFVSDRGANRVVAFQPVPTVAGRTASYTLGQTSLTAGQCNGGQPGPGVDSLCGPTGVSYLGGSLVVTDTDNNRLQLYNSDPNAAANAIGYFLVSVSPAAGPANSNMVAAGSAAHVVITAMNVDGTLNANYTGKVTLVSSDPNASLVANANFDITDAGELTLTSAFLTAGNQNIVAVDARRPKQVGEDNFVVVPGEANYMVVAGYPNPASAGQPNDFNMTVYDAYNNIATNYTGVVVITSNDGSATLPSPITFNANSMGRATASLTFGQAGINRITATDANNPLVTGSEFNILTVANAGPAVTFTFSGYISPIGAGAQGNVIVTARDANSLVAVGYLGSAGFTSTDPNATLPPITTFTQANQGVTQLTWTFTTSGNQTVTATDTNTPTITGTSPTVVVQGGNAVVIEAFNYPSPTTAGQSANITQRAIDAYGNIASTYRGLVSLDVTDPLAVASPNHRFVAGDNGNAQVPITFETVGTWTVTVQDVNVPSLVGEQNQVIVQSGPVAFFLVGNIPNPVAAGVNANIFVSPRDAYDNLATGYNGSVTISSSDPCASLPGPIAFTNGIQNTSPGVSLHTAGTWSVSANDAITPTLAGMENAIVVTPANAAFIAVTAYPSPVIAGQSANVTMTPYDAYGNAVLKYTGTVHLSSSDAQAILPADTTFTIVNAGVAYAPVILETSGLQTIHANDAVYLDVAGNQNHIQVNPNVAVRFKLSGFPAVINAGQTGNLTVTPAPRTLAAPIPMPCCRAIPPLSLATWGS